MAGDDWKRSLFVREFFHRGIRPEFVEGVELADTRHKDVYHHINEIQENPSGSPISFRVLCVDTFLLERLGDMIRDRACLHLGIN